MILSEKESHICGGTYRSGFASIDRLSLTATSHESTRRLDELKPAFSRRHDCSTRSIRSMSRASRHVSRSPSATISGSFLYRADPTFFVPSRIGRNRAFRRNRTTNSLARNHIQLTTKQIKRKRVHLYTKHTFIRKDKNSRVKKNTYMCT